MSIETWGEAPKSQIDPEKIEEAINRLIAVHEADPLSHTGENESLQAHRQNEIIDHPAGSLVPDKNSFKQSQIATYFESLSSWVQSGSIISGFLKLQCGVYGNAGADSYVYNELISFNCDDDLHALNNFVQFNGAFSDFYSIADLYFGLGVSDSIPASDYVLCFKIVGTTLSVGVGVGSGTVWHSIGSITANANHVFRISTSSEFNEAYFLVDGVVVYTVDLSGLTDWGYATFGLYVHKTGGTTNGQFKGFVTNFLLFANEAYGAY